MTSVVINKKNREPYLAQGTVVNATNSANGSPMMLYQSLKDGALYVRDLMEFGVKFSSTDVAMSEIISRQASPHLPLLSVLQGLVTRFDGVLDFLQGIADQESPEEPELPVLLNVLDDHRSFLDELALAGLFTPLVVKVQRPLASNTPNPGFLVYNEDRSLMEELAMDPAIIEWFGDDLKMYAKVRLWVDGTLQMVCRVEDLPW